VKNTNNDEGAGEKEHQHGKEHQQVVGEEHQQRREIKSPCATFFIFPGIGVCWIVYCLLLMSDF